MGFVAYAFVRFTRSFNTAGSVYAFNATAVGPRYGFVSTWILLLVYLSFAAGVFASTADIAQTFFASVGVHGWWVWFALVSAAAAVVLAYLRVGISALVILACEAAVRRADQRRRDRRPGSGRLPPSAAEPGRVPAARRRARRARARRGRRVRAVLRFRGRGRPGRGVPAQHPHHPGGDHLVTGHLRGDLHLLHLGRLQRLPEPGSGRRRPGAAGARRRQLPEPGGRQDRQLRGNDQRLRRIARPAERRVPAGVRARVGKPAARAPSAC